jgi:peptidoglycan hydrolase-like protein with peptidoglycan-binding domain
MTITLKKSFALAVLMLLLMHAQVTHADEVTASVRTETVLPPQPPPTPASNAQSSSSTSANTSASPTTSNSFSGGGYTSPTSGGVSGGMLKHTSATSGEVLGASTYNFARELTIGASGSDVTALQSLLISDGYLVLATPSGYFGSLTKAAVIKFQAAHSIRQTGYVGPLTLAALNAGTLPSTPEVTSSASSTATNLAAEIAALEAELAAIEASATSK